VDLGGLSHRGKVRANNEDTFFVARLGDFRMHTTGDLGAGAPNAQSSSVRMEV
jgi:hypothetical protein